MGGFTTTVQNEVSNHSYVTTKVAKIALIIKIRMHASALLEEKLFLGVLQPQSKGPHGLEGIISPPIIHWRAFFISFQHF